MNPFQNAKKSFATRRVPRAALSSVLTGTVAPKAGDLLLARIEELGQHKAVELESGRRARLFPGDEVILVYGNRYAPDQYEAFVPETLDACHMVAAGGIAAKAAVKHGMISSATRIVPVGLIADEGGAPVNLSAYSLAAQECEGTKRPQVIAVAGTSMNAGKTETATQLIRGLRSAGLKVGAAKVTGTGAGGDFWSMLDAGATQVLDFTDAGLATTYLADQERIEHAMALILSHLRAGGAEAVVLEVADGLFQKETAALLASPFFKERVDGVVFAANDALGAAAGAEWLKSHELRVLAISGLLTVSPLAARETKESTGLPVLRSDEIAKAEIADQLGMHLGNSEPALAASA